MPGRSPKPGLPFQLTNQVPIALSRQNMENIIDRHSQFVRWRKGQLCPAASKRGQHSIECTVCQNGYIFSIPDNINVINEQIDNAGHAGQIDFGKLISVDRLEKVTRDECQALPIRSIEGDREFLFSGNGITNNDAIFADYSYDLKRDLTLCGQYYEGNGVIALEEPIVKLQAGGEVSGDILEITRLRNVSTRKDIPFIKFARNLIFIDTTTNEPLTTDFIKAEGRYISPFSFAVLNVKQSQKYLPQHRIKEGDAVLLTANRFNIGEGDLITPLVGEQTGSSVIKRSSTLATDKLGVFEATQLLRIIVKDTNTTTKEFKINEDFKLIGLSQILWFGDKPADDQEYSVMFKYRPSYRIYGDMPTVRTSENERFPRRAVLKVFDRLSPRSDFL